MNLTKVVDLRRTKKSKNGKEYHPSWYVLSVTMPNGRDVECLINPACNENMSFGFFDSCFVTYTKFLKDDKAKTAEIAE